MYVNLLHTNVAFLICMHFLEATCPIISEDEIWVAVSSSNDISVFINETIHKSGQRCGKRMTYF